MNTNNNLFSRARPGQLTVKKACRFLALPGEVRNQIYGYYFQCDLRCELVAKGTTLHNAKSRTVKLCAGDESMNCDISKSIAMMETERPITVRIPRSLGKYNIVQGVRTDWAKSSYALNLVCKQVHTETLPFVYLRTIFIFNAPRRLGNFLYVISRPRLLLVTKLQLHYHTYGAPKLTEHIRWQDRHSESWITACRAASKTLQALRELIVWVQVNHSPLYFNLREKWVAPLLQFRRLGLPSTSSESQTASDVQTKGQRKLEIVQIHIHSQWSNDSLLAFNNNVTLAKVSTDLHIAFGRAIAAAILDAKEFEAMAKFNTAWTVTHRHWQYHLGYAKIGW